MHYYSDKAVSQYLEESGGCLTELMLNNVGKVISPFSLLEYVVIPEWYKSYPWNLIFLFRCGPLSLFPSFEQETMQKVQMFNTT